MEYFITSAGIPVHINESKKDGTAILLLHGYLETLYIWEDFQEFFPTKFRIISIDLPGHGLSGIPSEGFSPDFSNFFILGILDKLSVEKCFIISHSCGYYIASTFSKAYPERIFSIFNIGSSIYPSSDELSFINSIPSSIDEGTLLKTAAQFIPKMYYNINLRACDAKIEETIGICDTHDPEALRVFYKDFVYFFPTDDTQVLISTVPIFSISGQFQVFPSNDFNTFIIPNTGTNVFIENPGDVFDIISSLLT